MPSQPQVEVAQLWGEAALERRRFALGAGVTVGSGPGADLFAHAPRVGERHALLRPGRAEVLPPEDARVTVNGARARGEGPVPLRPGQAVRVEVGQLAFVVRLVEAGPRARFGAPDVGFAKTTLATGLWVVAALLAAALPRAWAGDGGDERSQMQRWAQSGPDDWHHWRHVHASALLPNHKPAKPEPLMIGAIHVDKPSPLRPEKHQPPSAQNGVKEALAALQSSPVLSNTLGADLNTAIAGLSTQLVASNVFGYEVSGSRDTGPGGGGAGLGLSGLGTIGSGGGRGSGGYGTIDLGGRGRDTVQVIPGQVILVGDVSRELVERVVKRHSNEVRFCYQVELQLNPAVAGRLAMHFVIDEQGVVESAQAVQNETGSTRLADCVRARLLRWRFPETRGGKLEVTYPWVLRTPSE